MSFAYDESKCGCHCDKYGFLQVMRPHDIDSGEFIQPNGDQQDRMVKGQADESLNGWAVDRIENRKYGYYHVDDNFMIEQSGILGESNNFGTAGLPAAMHDTIAYGDRWRGHSMMIVFLTAAVCLDSSTTCAGHMLGMQKWYVFLGKDNTMQKPTRLALMPSDLQAFAAAVDGWNQHSSGRVGLPTFTFP